MNIIDTVIILILVVILCSACFYIVKAKRNGEKCIGCPMSKQCASKNQNGTGCSCHSEKNK